MFHVKLLIYSLILYILIGILHLISLENKVVKIARNYRDELTNIYNVSTKGAFDILETI